MCRRLGRCTCLPYTGIAAHGYALAAIPAHYAPPASLRARTPGVPGDGTHRTTLRRAARRVV